ncbi:MAG: hypothetical protein GF353_20035 [Candidatus Lokiarchaeota archaeon]|nr:hypothetical protein [Candidatus Lokiarchaeota archaeon]
MVDLFNKLELGVLYNKTNVRDFLKEHCDDSISLPTTGELLDSIIEAEKRGLLFTVNDKIRKLIEKKTASDDSLYELIEKDTLNLNED